MGEKLKLKVSYEQPGPVQATNPWPTDVGSVKTTGKPGHLKWTARCAGSVCVAWVDSQLNSLVTHMAPEQWVTQATATDHEAATQRCLVFCAPPQELEYH